MRLPKIDTFVYLLFVAIIAAYIWPAGGGDYGSVSAGDVAGWGVGGVFFFYGLRLTPQKFKYGLTNVPLHLVVHTATFLLFPLLVLLVIQFVDIRPDNFWLWVGVFFVATLPSTVSSSVVMVSIAGGNVSAAIFNASISSLIGVFLTPLWMSIMVKSGGGAGFDSLLNVVLNLVLQVIVPIGVGMLLARYWGDWAGLHKRALRMFDQGVILAIVYTSFCESFAGDMFAAISWMDIVVLTLGMILLFAVVYVIIGGVCKWLKFNRQDRVTALFCGSKKSLVHGTVMSKVLVSNQSMVGVMLLPIMIYHAMQLVVVSVIAQRMADKQENEKLGA